MSALGTVSCGIEVEIVAWRPRRGGDTRYRVVPTTGGIEGWLGAANLQPRPFVPPPRPVHAAAPAASLAGAARRTKRTTSGRSAKTA
jgi:hypothetical protein